MEAATLLISAVTTLAGCVALLFGMITKNHRACLEREAACDAKYEALLLKLLNHVPPK